MSEFQYGAQAQEQPGSRQSVQGAQTAQPTQSAQPRTESVAERQMRVRQENAGKRFCRNCGGEIQVGASVCVHCNVVLNPVAIRRAQAIVMDRQAKVTRGMLIKSFFRPAKGMKLYKENLKNRPQVAHPCRKAAIWGRIVGAVVAVGAVALFIYSQIYPYL